MLRYCFILSLVLVVALAALFPPEQVESKPFHSEVELLFFKKHLRNPIDSGQYFLTSVRCKGCHGHDPTGLANVTEDGVDINLYDDWETSMMGLSSVDPFWRAKVHHEMLVNPDISDATQTFCTSCHAPMGHYTAKFHNATSYTLTDMLIDSMGLGGVGCNACHSIGINGLGSMFSGNIPYDTTKKLFGPFFNPFQGPMQLYTGLTPEFSEHVSQGEFCSPCHTLITKTVDLSGNYTGSTFVEQATFHEWKNSVYPALNITCQTCHMPEIDDPILIANGFASLQGRTPFNQHQFAGGNAFMINLIKQNKNTLGVSASDVQFDSTLAATYRLLKDHTLDLSLTSTNIAADTAYFTVTLKNKSGHKFPSGYPSRRAVVQFIVVKENGDTLFKSGLFNSLYEVANEDLDVEPHHQTITSDLRSQIYEMVMGDVQMNRTTVLERGAVALKDNRIPPKGFTSTHYSYDTIKVIGTTADPDFNSINNIEGSGTDNVYYRVKLNGYTGKVSVYSRVYYQSVPPRWLQEMFSYSSDFINSFRNMYNAADKTPVLVASDSLIALQTNFLSTVSSTVRIYPNPVTHGWLHVEGKTSVADVELYNSFGQRVEIVAVYKAGLLSIKMPHQSGIYYLRCSSKNGQMFKILRL